MSCVINAGDSAKNGTAVVVGTASVTLIDWVRIGCITLIGTGEVVNLGLLSRAGTFGLSGK
jgi:hypothetical protein